MSTNTKLGVGMFGGEVASKVGCMLGRRCAGSAVTSKGVYTLGVQRQG